MDFFTAFVYGVIQGISEFLPVSSSGHLALLPFFMKLKDPGVVFDLCMHVGTALAVIVYFWRKILLLIKEFFPAMLNLNSNDSDHHFVRNYLWATVISVIFIFALKPFSGYARNPSMIAFNQVFFGVLLWVADYLQKRNASAEKSSGYFSKAWHFKESALIGFAQSLAIFPGVSRSGITLTAAFMKGIDRAEAGAFSFLLSLPVIFGGVVLMIPDLLSSVGAAQQSWAVLFTGVAVSFVVGFLTIHFFMRLIARIHLGWFTIYRVILAAVLLAMI